MRLGPIPKGIEVDKCKVNAVIYFRVMDPNNAVIEVQKTILQPECVNFRKG